MNFELKLALTTLENRTPTFFVREALADQALAPSAHEVLKDLEGDKTATRRLIEMLRLY